MVNLILKDLKVCKRGLLASLGWWLFFIYLNTRETRSSAFPFIVISLVLVFQALFADDKNRTEKLYVSLPVKRSDIVNARYINAFLMMASVVVFTYLTTLLLNNLMPEMFKDFVPLKNLIGAHIVIIYFIVLLLPVFFKYGAHLEAGMKVITIMVVFLLVLLTAILTISLHFEINLIEAENILLYSGITAIILTIGSWLLSQRIYRKREF